MVTALEAAVAADLQQSVQTLGMAAAAVLPLAAVESI
jgi:hypothetical protein